jgi:hypothetical protein
VCPHLRARQTQRLLKCSPGTGLITLRFPHPAQAVQPEHQSAGESRRIRIGLEGRPPKLHRLRVGVRRGIPLATGLPHSPDVGPRNARFQPELRRIRLRSHRRATQVQLLGEDRQCALKIIQRDPQVADAAHHRSSLGLGARIARCNLGACHRQ